MKLANTITITSLLLPFLVTTAPTRRNTSLNEFLSLLLDDLPDIDVSINDAAGILTDLEELLADVTGLQTTYNGIGQDCTEYTVVFARGTTEPGNIGILVGPPLILALEQLVSSSSLTIQGVNNYAATIQGYLEGGDPNGSANMYVLFSMYYKSKEIQTPLPPLKTL